MPPRIHPASSTSRIAIVLLLRVLAAAALAAFGGALSAFPESQIPFPSFDITVYGVRDGLPQSTVQALAQTSDGYLWIGTTGGLVRFDGRHFVVFDSETVPAFHDNSVFALLATKDGSLWIGTEGGGLIRYRHGVFRDFSAADGLTDPFVRAIAQSRSGAILIGTDDGFFQLQNNRLQRLDGQNGLPSVAVNAICQSPDGDLWIGSSSLMSYHGGRWKQWNLPGESGLNRIKSIGVTRDGAVWVGTVSSLYRSAGGVSPFERVPGINGTVRVLRTSSDGTLWVGVVGQNSFAARLEPHSPWLVQKMQIDHTVLTYLEDAERDIWVGTQSGLMRLTPTPVSILPLPGARDSDFGTVYRDRDGTLWAASAHLFHIYDGRAHLYRFSQPGLAAAKVRTVLRDSHGIFWLGTEGNGLWRIGPSSVRHFTVQNGLTNNFIRALFEARDGSLWIGTDEGVSHLVHGSFIDYGLQSGLAYFSIRSILEDSDGDIWIGTARGLSHWRDGVWVHDRATWALRQQKIWTMYEDPQHGIWFGTRDNGLFYLHDGKLSHFTTSDGLASNSIYQILEDSMGQLWMSGPGGVAVMDLHELEAFAAGARHTQLRTLFYSIPSAATAQIFGGMQSAGVITPDGSLWFPSNEGLIHIARSRLAPASSPKLVIQQVENEGQRLPATGIITLPPGAGRLALTYALIMLRSQREVRFRYKMEGFDSHWNPALNHRTADYTNLPAGHYVFHVVAYDMEHPKSVSEASLLIVKRQFFYMTWWFRILMLVLVAGFLMLLHRLRVKSLQSRFQAVFEERSRVAREMHDTVIQGCNGASAVLEAVARTPVQQSELRENLIECARTQLRLTSEEARHAIWDLRNGACASENGPPGLTPALRQMCLQIGDEFHIPIRLHAGDLAAAGNSPAVRELTMIVREALHNAILHGRPAGIDLTVLSGNRQVRIVIVDDGLGFDPEALSTQSDGRFGLIGMQERATRLGGRVSVESSPGRGTRVEICMPEKSILRAQGHD